MDIQNKKYIVEKWEMTGMLSDCEDMSQKVILSTILEDIANNLIEMNDESEEFEIKVGIMIPMAARIFYEGIHDISFKKLNRFLDKNLSDMEKYMKESYGHMDGEAEFISDYTDKYIKEVNVI